MDKLDLILEELKNVSNRLDELDTKMTEGFQEVSQKLDVIKEQTATNTEYQYNINQIANKVSDLETDVKVIKKAISNQ